MKLFILILLGFSTHGISQEYFNKVIELDNSVIVNALQMSNENILIPFYYSMNGDISGGILKIDPFNNQLVKECINTTTTGAGLQQVNNYIYKPALYKSPSDKTIVLQKLNQDLTEVWTKEYTGNGDITTVARSQENEDKIFLLSQDDFPNDHRETNIKSVTFPKTRTV